MKEPVTQKTLSKKSLEKPEPRDIEAEKRLLGSLFIQPSLMYEALEYFSASDFYQPSHQKIFYALQELIENPAESFSNSEIDMVLIKDFLEYKQILQEVGGMAYLSELFDAIPTAANITYYAKRIHTLAERRRFLHTSLAAAYACYDDNITLDEIRNTALHEIQNDLGPMNAMKIDLSCQEEDERPLITLDNSMLLAKGDLMGIVSGIGKGKSNVCEVIASLYQNRHCEPQGKLQVMRDNDQGMCIYIDTERSTNECIRSLRRMQRRINTIAHPELLQGDSFTSFTFFSFVSQQTPQKKYQELIKLLHTTQHLELVIVDGLLDMFTNLNDLEESTVKIHQLFALANKLHFGLLYTIHENRNDDSGKGMGHVGGVAQRKSSAFLRLRRDKDNLDVRILDTDFANMKVRAGHESVCTAFTWDIDDHMFHEIHYDAPPPKARGRKALNLQENFEWVFLGKREMTYPELVKEYSTKHGVEQQTAKNNITRAIKDGIIQKLEDQYVLMKSEDIF